VRKQLAFIILTSSLAGINQARADLVHNMDMNGDYTEHLYSVTNAKVWDERPNGLPVRYWAPTSTGVLGTVIYKYDLGSEVFESASLYANLLANRSGDQTFLDVSSDGINYTTVDSGYVHPQMTPPYSLPVYDLSTILKGSSTAYVRARMIGSQLNTDIFSAQFLRTADDVPFFKAPYVYQFQAETALVPEPSTLASCLAGGLVLLITYCRRRGDA
jgi:hypothetical protein